ncbi:FAD-dependent oxidoreductase [Saccharophagus degradans]|uniref:Pyridine nucleotide-disulphide oxidoreductase dimerisation region n=1 Tax=Saccharophagus degradans (strain 2-40 / ATCC 43961 / DSM 17024) TaxID=203122 RepID=Q21EH1_SACD2|nr:bifunctional TVP38/TMEM64 family protein/FAD-dependent oxidoreductase [Saccharophagus degradans]ABD82908.1 pyridine nucleotide-disulphide oxidoreductase dimerisation region [Saccharophagus degradans 2-40]
MTPKKIGVLLVVALCVCAFFYFDLDRYIAVGLMRDWVAQSPVMASTIFALLYFMVAALSLPGTGAMTLLAGAVFGLWWGFLLVSFASTIGATVNMLVSRLLLRDWVTRRFRTSLERVNEGVEREGSFYLFSIRLIPLVPFFVVNPVFGLTNMRATTFYWVSQVGMVPGTLLYVNAGVALGALDSISMGAIFTPQIIGSLVLLALFPWVAKAIVEAVKRKRTLAKYKKPKHFDANLIVIGAGSGGLVAAYIAAAVKAKVILVEKDLMGGDCLNTGCVPSKALIKAAKVAHQTRNAQHLGINAQPEIDFAKVMQHVKGAVKQIEPHDSVERYTSLGVDCVQGEAEIISPYEVRVNGKVLAAKNIIVATGAAPSVRPIEGLDTINYLTTDTVWNLTQLPNRLVIAGGGPIGCEMAQAFARLGSQVTVVQRGDQLLPKEDADVAEFALNTLRNEGVEVLLNAELTAVAAGEGKSVLTISQNENTQHLECDQLLLALGRTPRLQGFGLENIGVAISEQGKLLVDRFLRTSIPTVYACGDVIGPYQFTHAASHQAWYASVNALFGGFKSFSVDYSALPWVTFTDPEIARVGASEMDLKKRGVHYEVTRYSLVELDRAIAEGEAHGFVKVLTEEGKDRILGAVIVGSHGGEMITEFVSAIKHGKGLNAILGTVHSYPTWSEANKAAAGKWKQAHAPQRLLQWVEKFHRWQR